jgi:hypothetical protein
VWDLPRCWLSRFLYNVVLAISHFFSDRQTKLVSKSRLKRFDIATLPDEVEIIMACQAGFINDLSSADILRNQERQSQYGSPHAGKLPWVCQKSSRFFAVR